MRSEKNDAAKIEIEQRKKPHIYKVKKHKKRNI